MSDPAVENVVTLEGLDFISNANQTNTATLFITLKPWGEREADSLQLPAVIARANRVFAGISEAQGFAFNMPEIPGLGVTAGLEMYIQNRSVGTYPQFVQVGQEFLKELNATGTVRARTGVRPDVPAYHLDVDREKAKSLGLTLSDVFQTLQAMLSTYYVNDFNLFGKTYRVQVEAKPQFRTGPQDIAKLYVRNESGAMVPLSAFSQGRMQGGPALVTRFNGFTAAQVNGEPPPGKSSGEMLAAAERLGIEFAPRGLGTAYGGQSLQEKLASGSTAMIFVLGIVLVLLILAAQYESWSLPVAVILVVPFGLLGALLAIAAAGHPQRSLLHHRPGDGGRTGGEERHPHRGVCQRPPPEGRIVPGRRDPGGQGALSPDPHDQLRIHPRRGAIGHRDWRRRRQPQLAGHRRVRWDACGYNPGCVLHAVVLHRGHAPDHPFLEEGRRSPGARNGHTRVGASEWRRSRPEVSLLMSDGGLQCSVVGTRVWLV